MKKRVIGSLAMGVIWLTMSNPVSTYAHVEYAPVAREATILRKSESELSKLFEPMKQVLMNTKFEYNDDDGYLYAVSALPAPPTGYSYVFEARSISKDYRHRQKDNPVWNSGKETVNARHRAFSLGDVSLANIEVIRLTVGLTEDAWHPDRGPHFAATARLYVSPYDLDASSIELFTDHVEPYGWTTIGYDATTNFSNFPTDLLPEQKEMALWVSTNHEALLAEATAAKSELEKIFENIAFIDSQDHTGVRYIVPNIKYGEGVQFRGSYRITQPGNKIHNGWLPDIFPTTSNIGQSYTAATHIYGRGKINTFDLTYYAVKTGPGNKELYDVRVTAKLNYADPTKSTMVTQIIVGDDIILDEYEVDGSILVKQSQRKGL